MGIPRYVSPEEYSRQSGLGIEEVKRQCRMGNIAHLMTEGGYYKILEETDNTVSREKYERLQEENSKLKTIISIISQTAKQVNLEKKK